MLLTVIVDTDEKSKQDNGLRAIRKSLTLNDSDSVHNGAAAISSEADVTVEVERDSGSELLDIVDHHVIAVARHTALTSEETIRLDEDLGW